MNSRCFLLGISILYLAVCSVGASESKRKELSIEGIPDQIDLGVLDQDIAKIDIKFKDVRFSSADIVFKKFIGSCGCFKAAEYPARVDENEAHQILLKFDLSKIPKEEPWQTNVVMLIESGGKTYPVQIGLSARFGSTEEVLIAPNSAKLVYGEQSLGSFSVFVESFNAQGVSLRLGRVPDGLSCKIEFPIFNGKVLGRYQEVARISYEGNAPSENGFYSTSYIEVLFHGKYAKSYFYRIDTLYPYTSADREGRGNP